MPDSLYPVQTDQIVVDSSLVVFAVYLVPNTRPSCKMPFGTTRPFLLIVPFDAVLLN